MAINFTDFSRAPILESPVKNMFENALKGYQISQEPAKMQEEQTARQLANKFKQLEVEHKPKEFELDDQGKALANSMKAEALKYLPKQREMSEQLNQSRIDKNKRGDIPKGNLAAAFKIRDNLDPQSPTYERDLRQVTNYIDKLGSNPNGINVSTNPEGGVDVSIGNNQSGVIPGVGKLPSGHQAVFDKEGKYIGQNVEIKGAALDKAKATNSWEVTYPFLNKSLGEYSGKGSWSRFNDDMRNYENDPAARQRILDFFAAKDLMKVTSITENARIGGRSTNSQLAQVMKTLERSEVPDKLEDTAGFRLPQGYRTEAGNIFKTYLDKSAEAEKNTPLYEFRPLNAQGKPVSQGSSSAPANQSHPEIIGTQNGVTTIRNGGKTLKIPEHLVDKYMIEHSPKQFGGQYGQ